MSTIHFLNRSKASNFNKILIILFGMLVMILSFCLPAKADVITLELNLGKMADYGASPWYTEDISLGENKLKLSPDSGANFVWATSDLCTTDACNAHSKVNTTQAGFTWIDETPTERSFGPWGTMITQTGDIVFHTEATPIISFNMPFFASTEYTGNKFKYLAWDGGLGFPSNTADVEPGSGFYFGTLYEQGIVSEPTYSVVTEPALGQGFFYLGGENPTKYDADSAIELQPKKGDVGYLWGTTLYSVSLNEDIPSLTNKIFYLDTGSSLFKGDDIYVQPILEQLYALTDSTGKIFEKVFDDEGNWISLVYRDNTRPSDYEGILPNFTLTIGQTCDGTAQSAQITLSPAQYSYFVQEGERQDRWVPAFTVLNGVGGLLVGSTFMDLFYTTFHHIDIGDKKLEQGNMVLYQKTLGISPQNVTCVPTPTLKKTAALNTSSPVVGTWHNSYCSKVELSVENDWQINGIYTSHTGSTGSSNVIGWVGNTAANSSQTQDIPVNPTGIPVALGIQWRLINLPITSADNSWHWISTFSGQYHPQQTVQQAGQEDYVLEETLEIFNGLIATATYPGFTDTAPKMWPQTLSFHREAPSYCEPVITPSIEPFTGTAIDHISGEWINATQDMLTLEANMNTGNITGEYREYATGKTFTVTGLADAIAGTLGEGVAEQGMALTMNNNGTVLSMAGGVSLSNTSVMNLWIDKLSSTTWTSRYMESTVDKLIWTRVKIKKMKKK